MNEMLHIQNPIIEEIKKVAFVKERTIYLMEDISDETELIINRMFEKIEREDITDGVHPKDARPIKFKISSFGGSVLATLSIISTIESMKDRGYEINGYAYGAAMSGAFKIFISCSRRYAQKNTSLMYHQPNIYRAGYSTVEKDKRNYEDINKAWEKCKDVIKKYTKITEEELQKITETQRDVYIYGEDAIELGIVDELF